MTTIFELVTVKRLEVVIPELTRLRGYSEAEGARLLASVLALPLTVQAEFVDHFQTELAAWRRACGLPEPFSQPAGASGNFKGGNHA